MVQNVDRWRRKWGDRLCSERDPNEHTPKEEVKFVDRFQNEDKLGTRSEGVVLRIYIPC